MATDRRVLTCDEVMDELDQSPPSQLSEAVRSHISGCSSCAKYEALGGRLASAAAKEPDRDRWSAYRSSLEDLSAKARRSRLGALVTGAALAASVAVVFSLGLFVGGMNDHSMTALENGNRIVSNSSTMTPVSDYDPETTDLNYYYEISYRN